MRTRTSPAATAPIRPKAVKARLVRAWKSTGAGLGLHAFARALSREKSELGTLAREWLQRKGLQP